MRTAAAAALLLALASTAPWGISQVIPGGGTGHSSSENPTVSSAVLPAVSPDFVIGPGDILQVSVWHEPQFGEIVEVRPDGRISLPLISDVRVAGLTTAGAQNQLEGKLEEFVKHPVVSVVVAEVRSKQVFVIGQVQRPGPYPLLGTINVEQLIAEAGGATPRAKRKAVYVLRAGSSGKIPVNYKKILQGKNAWQNIELGAGDTVVVP